MTNSDYAQNIYLGESNNNISHLKIKSTRITTLKHFVILGIYYWM